MAKRILKISAFLGCLLILAACSMPALPQVGPQAPTPIVYSTLPVSTPTSQPPPATAVPGSLRGSVWKDVCLRPGDGLPAPEAAPSGCVINAQGSLQANGVREAGEPGIAGVTVSLGQGACPAAVLLNAQTDAGGAYTFANLAPGQYCVMISLQDANNIRLLLPGSFSYPSNGQAGHAVTVVTAQEAAGVDFAWDAQFQIAPQPTSTQAALPSATLAPPPPAPTATQPPPPPPTATQPPLPAPTTCTYEVAFVADVTIPDGSVMSPGQAFTKVWRLRNIGTCTWGPGQPLNAFIFTGGSQFGAPAEVPIANLVRTGQELDITINMVAPTTPGDYISEWKFRVQNDPGGFGPTLGLGPNRSQAIYTRIRVSANLPQNSNQRVSFAPGGTQLVLAGKIQSGQIKGYTLRALRDQIMILTFSATDPAAGLTIVAENGNTVPQEFAPGRAYAYARLPATQDYTVNVVGAYLTANFNLVIDIPARISFSPGAISAKFDGQNRGALPTTYLLRALQGQTMTINLASPDPGMRVTVYGLTDGRILADRAASPWSGLLPANQDYVIMVIPSVDSTTFTLDVTVQ